MGKFTASQKLKQRLRNQSGKSAQARKARRVFRHTMLETPTSSDILNLQLTDAPVTDMKVIETKFTQRDSVFQRAQKQKQLANNVLAIPVRELDDIHSDDARSKLSLKSQVIKARKFNPLLDIQPTPELAALRESLRLRLKGLKLIRNNIRKPGERLSSRFRPTENE